ncbi:MAG: hypothetical protein HWN68_16210 [Desulfobacterales bacterium]|nr:hypothetical protein [Desulfobacterales bacterium]
MSWVIPTLILILQYMQTSEVKKDVKEKLQEIIDKLAGLVPDFEAPIVEVITEPKLANRYKIITQTLAAALTDHAIGIKDLMPTTGFCTYMNILAVGGGFTFKINSSGAEAITAAVGMELEDYEIEEIFLTCGAVGGNAIFYLEYRVED